ncbi:MAG: VWA domain-containing protein [Acidobacteriota bacterium]
MNTQLRNLKHLTIGSTSLLLIIVFCALPVVQTSSAQNEKGAPAAPSTNDNNNQRSEEKEVPPIIKSGTNLVTLNITVTDPYGRYVTGLGREHFEVFDEKVPQKIEYFSDDDAPLTVGIIFDISGSMKGRIDRSHAALRRFCDAGHDRDEYFLVTFNNGAKLTQDFTGDSRVVTNCLTLIEPKGQTALYDAAYIGVEKVRHGRHPRKALLVISDGQDNNSRYSYKELKQLVKEADVQIYAIGVTNVFSPRELDIDGQVILEELTRLTGGRAFFPSNEAELNEVITRIGLELRHQYSIGYEPTGTNQDGHWHKIRVKVNAPKGLPPLTIRTREGYFANMMK